MKRFGEMLRSLRESRGLTQAELGAKLGISRGAIGNYEKGIRRPDFETLEAIADFFNVGIGYLIGRDESDKELYSLYLEKFIAREKERDLLEMFRKLNKDGQNKALVYIEDLVAIHKYTEPSPKASETHSAS